MKFDGDEARTLHKVTLAPQVASARGFWARPVLRAFVTWATWNEAAEAAASIVRESVRGGEPVRELVGVAGTISDPVFDDTNGWSVGLQMEAWW